jgi:hypothetical protein
MRSVSAESAEKVSVIPVMPAVTSNSTSFERQAFGNLEMSSCGALVKARLRWTVLIPIG